MSVLRSEQESRANHDDSPGTSQKTGTHESPMRASMSIFNVGVRDLVGEDRVVVADVERSYQARNAKKMRFPIYVQTSLPGDDQVAVFIRVDDPSGKRSGEKVPLG